MPDGLDLIPLLDAVHEHFFDVNLGDLCTLVIRNYGCGCLGFGCIQTDVVLLVVVEPHA